MDAFVGAGGAIATDLVVNNLPLPPMLADGWGKDLARMGTAIGIGWMMERGLKQKKLGREMVKGSMVVIAHGIVSRNFGANLGLSDFSNPLYYPGMSVGTGMGAYDHSSGMGAYDNAAPVTPPMGPIM
jgi:hypothetical protein